MWEGAWLYEQHRRGRQRQRQAQDSAREDLDPGHAPTVEYITSLSDSLTRNFLPGFSFSLSLSQDSICLHVHVTTTLLLRKEKTRPVSFELASRRNLDKGLPRPTSTRTSRPEQISLGRTSRVPGRRAAPTWMFHAGYHKRQERAARAC